MNGNCVESLTTSLGHDHDRDCVMYWAYEGEDLFDVLSDRFLGGNEQAFQFDQRCRADLAAILDE